MLPVTNLKAKTAAVFVLVVTVLSLLVMSPGVASAHNSTSYKGHGCDGNIWITCFESTFYPSGHHHHIYKHYYLGVYVHSSDVHVST